MIEWKRRFVCILCCSLLLVAIREANAAPVSFFDDFNSENGGFGSFEHYDFKHWDVTNGNIALIGNGFFDFYPGNGLYLDLGGSFTNTPGTLTSKQTFMLEPGMPYVLSFDLGWNFFNPFPSDTVEVSLGSVYSQSFTLFPQTFGSPLTRFTQTIGVNSPASGQLIFRDTSSLGLDSEGLILDNVRLQAVPEPSTLWLFAIGAFSLAHYCPRRSGRR